MWPTADIRTESRSLLLNDRFREKSGRSGFPYPFQSSNSSLSVGRFPPIPVANKEMQSLAAVSALCLLMTVAASGVTVYEQYMSVLVLTIAISVYAHGISAVPLSRR